MPHLRVIIPGEQYKIVEFIQEDMPGVAAINSNLKTFEPKEVFAWHFSIMFDLEDLADNGMPSIAERELMDNYGELLDKDIKGPDDKKPNALFLARITWNGTRELIWRVYNPELTNNYLQQVMANDSSPRPFDYRIDPDKEWKLAEWHLSF